MAMKMGFAGVRSLSATLVAAMVWTGCNQATSGSGDTGSVDTDTTESDTDTDADADTDVDTDVDVIADLEGHLDGFDLRHVKEQSYWYSRYNLGSLVMKGGNGVLFMPDMGMMMDMMAMVSDDDSTAVGPLNPALLNRLYVEGNPAFVNADDGDAMDFWDQRWDASPNTSTDGLAAGWTLVKELEWAKQFHVDAHFGAPGDGSGIPGAQERFSGMALYVLAVMQANEWLMNPGAFDQTDPGGQYVMLLALSDLSDVTSATALPHSTSNRYRLVADMMAPTMGMADADEMAGGFMMGADAIFMADPDVTSIEGLSYAAQALNWYALLNVDNRQAAKDRLRVKADALDVADASTPVEQAHVVRGLIEAHRTLGDQKYIDGATEAYEAMEADFDWGSGAFVSQSTYTSDDVAVILGALNATLNHGDAGLVNAIPLLEHFFEAVVNIGGLQISAPPMSAIAPYEQFSDELFHRYPTVPLPPMAGGDLGIAPVFASETTTDGAGWSASSTFHTAGGMHLANEMLWMHVDEVNGFPEVP